MSRFTDRRRHPSFHNYGDGLGADSEQSTPRASVLNRPSPSAWVPSIQQSPYKAKLLEPLLTTTVKPPSEGYNPSDDEEHMVITVNSSHVDLGTDNSQARPNQATGEGKGYMGGFVNNLKSLQKAVKGSRVLRLNTVDSGQTEASTATNDTGATTLPTYEADAPAFGSNIAFVEPVDMPAPEIAPSSVVVNPSEVSTPVYATNYRVLDADTRDVPLHSHQHAFQDLHPGRYDGHPQQSICSQQTTNARSEGDEIYSRVHPDVDIPCIQINGLASSPDFTISMVVPASSNSSRLLSTPSDSPRSDSSIQTPSEPSSPSRLGFGKFVKTLYRLPWFSSRITSVYVPHGRSDGRQPTEKLPSSSWYYHPRHSLDLFSEESSPASPSFSAGHHQFSQARPLESADLRLTPPSPRRQSLRQRTTSDINSASRAHGNPTRIRDREIPTATKERSHRRRHARNPSASSTNPNSSQSSRSREKRHRLRTVSESGQRSPMSASLGVPLYPFPYSSIPQPLFVLTPPRQPSDVGGLSEVHQAMPLYVVTPMIPLVTSSPHFAVQIPKTECS